MPDGSDEATRKAGLAWFLAVFLGALACLALLPPTEKPEQADETAWIAVGAESFALLRAGDVSRASWDDPRWGPFGYAYPVLGKLFIGAAVTLAGHGPEARALLPAGGFDWEAIRRTRPSPAALAAGRAPQLLFGALSAWLLFRLVALLTAKTTLGALAAACFVTRPLVLESARQAMVDMPALAFGLLALACAADRRAHRSGSRIVLAGAACGLAAASKLSGGLALAVVLLWWVLPGKRPPLARSAALLVLAAALSFVAVQPPAWSGPLDHLSALVEHARLVEQYDVPAERRLAGWSARAAQVASMGLLTSDPLRAWLGLPGVGGALVVLGALVSRRRPGGGALLGWWALVALTIAWSVPFDWRRWYLPLEPCWAALQALGLHALLVGVTELSRIRRRGART